MNSFFYMPHVKRARGLASAVVVAAAFGAAGLSAPSQAGFFIPKDNWMAMSGYTPDEINLDLAYGLRRDLSLSIGLTRVREAAADGKSGSQWRNVWIAQGAYLLNRVPTEDGIANAYVFGGPLVEQREAGGKAHLGASTGLWFDYETRRIYTRLKLHSMKAFAGEGGQNWRRNEVIGQAMWAPYAADYEDVASWIGVQAKRVSDTPQTEITPYVRFFRKNWWVDAGVSVDAKHRRDVFVNFMYLF
jgi:hypothetical protein